MKKIISNSSFWMPILAGIIIILILGLCYRRAKVIAQRETTVQKSEAKATVLPENQEDRIYSPALGWADKRYGQELKRLGDSLTWLNCELANCGQLQKPAGKTEKPKAAAPKKKTLTPAASAEKIPPPPKIETQAPLPAGGVMENVTLHIAEKYDPVFEGDVGVTFFCDGSGYAYPDYYLSNVAYEREHCSSAEVSGQNGQAMSLGQNGYWQAIDFNTRLTPDLIENGHFQWSIYIGDFQDQGFSYPRYLPHESIKPIIRQVRGREDGEITADDLKAMAPYSVGIEKGCIRPNDAFGTGTDGKRYEGWEFYMNMSYKKKN